VPSLFILSQPFFKKKNFRATSVYTVLWDNQGIYGAKVSHLQNHDKKPLIHKTKMPAMWNLSPTFKQPSKIGGML
jgi:hypothetical protein